jgi:NAD(P)H-hydrate epimerase
MIKILTAGQMRAADEFTTANEPIDSIELMERASNAFCEAICEKIKTQTVSSWLVFCGPGNNGGDGLAITRLLHENNEVVSPFYLYSENGYSDDFKTNLQRLQENPIISIYEIRSEKDFPRIAPGTVLVDALFGSGLNKPLQGLNEKLVDYLNHQNIVRISVDIPSGLSADHFIDGISFHAHHTVTFQSPKLSFLFSENAEAVGEIHCADIGLNQEHINSLPSSNFYLDEGDIRKRIRVRKKFDHKGNYGHAFIHAGNTGKMGAAIMCAKACARAGAGLTTAFVPLHQSPSLNISVPEVMTEEYVDAHSALPDLKKYSAFAFGPGIGMNPTESEVFHLLLRKITMPVVLDADALNILSVEKNWWNLVPKNSILTPHPKEFERLVGKTTNWEERHNKQLQLSVDHSLYIVLKGAYTCITTPDGNSYFNPTGNPGMAKGGSGDVLTGMLVSLLAQQYSPEDACIIGVYLHGLAADIAVEYQSHESLLASDIINRIGDAFKKIENPEQPYTDPVSDSFDFDDRAGDSDRDIMRLN